MFVQTQTNNPNPKPDRDFHDCRTNIPLSLSLSLSDQDIVNSVMGNMGWFDSESYGLTWKVRGFCKDSSNPEVFDRTNVYGDILNSEIYGMYYGHYTYGHQGGVWTNNIMRDNVQYGFDPHDDSDYLTIADNIVYGNGNHGEKESHRRLVDSSIYSLALRDFTEDRFKITKSPVVYTHPSRHTSTAKLVSKLGTSLSSKTARSTHFHHVFYHLLPALQPKSQRGLSTVGR